MLHYCICLEEVGENQEGLQCDGCHFLAFEKAMPSRIPVCPAAALPTPSTPVHASSAATSPADVSADDESIAVDLPFDVP